ncbi:hypothetical protein SUGI_0574040 [Cryptomeria japonica]|nr:hypothetical protein SUGI_0574040 [Cryptomeria japonica]
MGSTLFVRLSTKQLLHPPDGYWSYLTFIEHCAGALHNCRFGGASTFTGSIEWLHTLLGQDLQKKKISYSCQQLFRRNVLE